MKYGDASLLTKFTTMKEGVMHFHDIPISQIPLGTWEHMLRLEKANKNEPEMVHFLEMMIERAKKNEQVHE